MFIKKIFDRNIDSLVHLQFQKFSKGYFKNRAAVIVKNSNGKFSISTSHEYANGLIRFLAEKLGNLKTKVSGILVSTRDINIDYENKKQFMGVKQYVIDKEMTGVEILDLCNKFTSSFIALSFKVNDNDLKIKPKSPKSAKPSTKENNNKPDFCKIKTTDINLIRNLIFDEEINLNFKEVVISHDFIINEIIITDEMKKLAGNDYSKLRELAIRKGKIVRKLKVDGKEFVKEKEFEV